MSRLGVQDSWRDMCGGPLLPNALMSCVVADGSARPQWLPVLDLLENTSPLDIEARLAGAQQHIRDEGITYTIYADPQGRDRPGR